MTYQSDVLGLSGLVAYWRLNEAGGASSANDETTNNLDLTTFSGGVTTGQATLLSGGGTGGSFDLATANISRADDALLDLGDIVSIVAMIRPDTVSGVHGILSKGTGAYYLRQQDAGFLFLKSEVAGIVGTTGVTMVVGTIYHVVMTKTGATVKIYVDGVDRTGTVTNATLVNNALALRVGADSTGGGASEQFDGRVAEVALFNRALTAAEAAALYDSSQGVSPTLLARTQAVLIT